MNLREQAEKDLEFILEDGALGFGWPIVLTDPEGFTSAEPLTGYGNDISELIDPETGQAVSGRSASVALRLSSIIAEGYTGYPKQITDRARKPWVVQFDDINGNTHLFKVVQSNPDRTLGIITLLLEFYK